MAPLRILIVDDHPFFRQGVRFYLEGLEEFQLSGEVGSGEEALAFVESNLVDVVLMDLQMPGLDGIATTRALLNKNQDLRVLVLTSSGSGEKTQQALQAGAGGYCLKDAPPEELVTAICAVAGGGTYLGQGIHPDVLSVPLEGRDGVLLGEMTRRELEVLRLLAAGMGNREIATQLVVSEKTVKTHVANILQKLGVKTRTQAALLASKSGLNQGDGQ